MAEQFLNKLNQIESSIDGLGETLKRMITVLGAITEIRSEITQAKTEILAAINELKEISSAPPEAASAPTLPIDELEASFKNELEGLRTFVATSLEAMVAEVSSKLDSVPAPVAAAAVTPAAAPPSTTPAPVPEPTQPVATMTSSLPADKSMKIAGQLSAILKSLKMGCKSGDVQDAMVAAKEEITKIVPSDPVMIHIDKWIGVVASYPKRKELQARDILKLKKEIKAEIDTYSPA